MKIIFGTLILFSATLSAQEKNAETLQEPDSLKSGALMKELMSINAKNLQSGDSTKINDIYKMPIAKPKDSSVYLSLKEKEKDHSKYKILNSLDPEKLKKKVKNK